MSDEIHRYAGDRLVVFYDKARCIHAATCVAGSRAVFDPERRPWVDPDALPPTMLSRVVETCPSGALWYARSDGGPGEKPPPFTRVRLVPDGPLHVHGPMTLDRVPTRGPGTRLALCRCGASKTKPLCDGSHVEAGFSDPGTLDGEEIHPPEHGPCKVVAIPNGPLMLRGWVEIRGVDAEGDQRRVHDQVALCRCGASKNKPYCDGAHNKIDFRTDR